MTLDTQRLQTLAQVGEFLAGSRPLALQPRTRAQAYAFVAETLQRFDYPRLGKADKGLIRRFLAKLTGLSRAQVARLPRQHRTTGAVADRRAPFPAGTPRPTSGCSPKSTPCTAPSPAPLPAAGSASGPDTCSTTAASSASPTSSNGHLYNLGRSAAYRRRRGALPAQTRPAPAAIGERRRPRPFGQRPKPSSPHPQGRTRTSAPDPARRLAVGK